MYQLTQFTNSMISCILFIIYRIATVLLKNIISCLVFIGLGIMGFHPSLLFLRLSSYSGCRLPAEISNIETGDGKKRKSLSDLH